MGNYGANTRADTEAPKGVMSHYSRLPDPTVNLIREVQRAILAEPKLYDQYAVPELACDTPCCIAGWAVWCKNPNKAAYRAAMKLAMYSDHYVESWRELGAPALGVPEEKTRNLFSGYNVWPAPFVSDFIAAKNDKKRAHQLVDHEWDAEHDDKHTYGEIAAAASAYVLLACDQVYPEFVGTDFDTWAKNRLETAWPWGDNWWKPSRDPIHNLEKAGALIAAEIDRLKRLKERSGLSCDVGS